MNIPVKSAAVAKQKIHQALSRLGICFISAADIVVYDSEAETAYWRYDLGTGKEQICVGPEIAAMDIPVIEMVLRHEFLHRSTFHSFHERFEDQQLLNIVEDICINRLLFEIYPEKMKSLSEKVYSSEAKKTIIALADCTADPGILPSKVAALWNHIWIKNEYGFYSTINPSSLYYRLIEIRSKEAISFKFLLSILISGTSFPEDLSENVRILLEQFIKQISSMLSAGVGSAHMMNEYLTTSIQLKDGSIKDFIYRLKIDHSFSQSRENLINNRKCSYSEVYPAMPSPRGMLYLISGLSDTVHLYHNMYKEINYIKLKLCFYVDISGSMSNYYAQIHYFIKEMVDVPLMLKFFSDNLKEVSPEDFIKGNYPVGGGTDFNIVVRDLLEDSDMTSAVIFTDGDAVVSAENLVAMKESTKKLFLVCFYGREDSIPKTSLDSVVDQVLYVEIL